MSNAPTMSDRTGLPQGPSPHPSPRSNPECCDLEHTEAVEDYLKVIFHLDSHGGASTSVIADRLGVSAPSVSAMLRRLSESSLVDRGSRAVSLTEHGRRHALRVVRRHRLLETFLAEVLDVPWDEVHDEAEVLEHALSEQLEARIDAYLGQPERDPHGDPIPPAEGEHDESWAEPLWAAPAGAAFTVERVSDRDPAALRYLADLGIRPGVTLVVGERDPFGGPLWVEVGSAGERRPLGPPLARLVTGRWSHP